MQNFQTSFPLFLLIMTVSVVIADMQSNKIWLNIQQYNCLHTGYPTLQQSIKQNYQCILHNTLHCIQDSFSYVEPFRLSAHSFCGFINGENIQGNPTYWTLMGKPAIMLDFLYFSLSHISWKCSLNHHMRVTYDGHENIFCGFRYPWKIHANIDELQIKLQHDFQVMDFKMQFYRFPRIYDTQKLFITKHNLTRFSFSSSSYLFDVMYHFYARNRAHNIRINIPIIYDNHTLITCYDGPGTLSPVLRYSSQKQVETYLSSAFHIFCVIQKRTPTERGSEEEGDEKEEAFYISYLSQHKTNWTDDHQEGYACGFQKLPMHARHFQIYMGMLGHMSRPICSVRIIQRKWSTYSPLLILDVAQFAMNREVMLLEGEPCFYGGIFVYGNKLTGEKIGDEWLELMNYCEPNDGHYNPTFISDVVDYFILFISFEGYSDHKPIFEMISLTRALKYIEWERTISAQHDTDTANPITLSLKPLFRQVGYGFRSDPSHQYKLLYLNFVTSEVERRNLVVRLNVLPEEYAHCLTCYATQKPFESNYFNDNNRKINLQQNPKYLEDKLFNVDKIVINETNCDNEEVVWEIFVEYLEHDVRYFNNISSYQLIKDSHSVISRIMLTGQQREAMHLCQDGGTFSLLNIQRFPHKHFGKCG